MIRFRTRLLGFSNGSSDRNPKISRTVSEPGPITRFLFSGKFFARAANRAKRHAFSLFDGKLSVFCIDQLTEAVIWRIGRNYAGAARGEAARARADLQVSDVRMCQLEVVAAPTNHPRHANIVGWPDEKERVRLLAMESASRSSLRLP